jgi:hypothetical protein
MSLSSVEWRVRSYLKVNERNTTLLSQRTLSVKLVVLPASAIIQGFQLLIFPSTNEDSHNDKTSSIPLRLPLFNSICYVPTTNKIQRCNRSHLTVMAVKHTLSAATSPYSSLSSHSHSPKKARQDAPTDHEANQKCLVALKVEKRIVLGSLDPCYDVQSLRKSLFTHLKSDPQFSSPDSSTSRVDYFIVFINTSFTSHKP